MIFQKVKTFFSNCKIYNKNILLSYSAGVDSSVLLDILLKIKDEFGLKIYVFYLDHGLRDSDVMNLEVEFVNNQLANKDLIFFVKRIENGYLKHFASENKLSLEDCARNFRYKFLKRIETRNNIDYIVLGHHLDDDIETQIMRFFNFGSFESLSGIEKINKKFLRPMLEIEKKQIYKYAREFGILYKQDKTNFENDYLRNRVRNDLIFEIEKTFPNYKQSLFKLKNSIKKPNLDYFSYKSFFKHYYACLSLEEFLSLNEKERALSILKCYSKICQLNKMKHNNRLKIPDFEIHFENIHNKIVSFNDFSIELKDNLVYLFPSFLLKKFNYLIFIKNKKTYNLLNKVFKIEMENYDIRKTFVIKNAYMDKNYPIFLKKFIPVLFCKKRPIFVFGEIVGLKNIYLDKKYNIKASFW